MATSLQVTMASLCPSAKSLSTRRRPVCCAAKIPMPPLNPNDPFLSRLSKVAAEAPERLISRPEDEDSMPYLDLFESPKLMAYPAHAERSASYRSGHRSRRPPPDLPSILLDGRIIYIGMPLVPAVSELVIAQLVYLAFDGSPEPIYLYINSTGTSRDDGERVGLESEGFAIYDALMNMEVPIKTLCLGIAVGQACLLLAAGTKGQRFIMPHARAILKQPRYPSTGLMPASDVQIHASEVKINRDNLVRLMARHTGNSDETVFNAMKRRYTMNARGAVEFGVVDKIMSKRDEKVIGNVASPEEWDRRGGVQVESEDDF